MKYNKLYGDNLILSKKIDDTNIFSIKNELGNGEIKSYKVFEGVHVIYNNMNLEYCSSNKQPISNYIEINHCRIGRYECEYTPKRCIYMSEGDLAIQTLKTVKTGKSFFPTGHYNGITILIDLNKFKEHELFKNFGINIYDLCEVVNNEKSYRIIRANDSLEHIFYEFYQAEGKYKVEYLRVKIIEVLLFILKIDWNKVQEKEIYLTTNEVDKIKKIKDFIISDISQHYTVEKLSKMFDIATTPLKLQFKEIYGTSIYKYLKIYRLQQAANYLYNEKMSIAEIANKIGYSNPAKFSSAFKKEYGMSPIKYRKSLKG